MMNGKIVNCQRHIKKRQLETNQDIVIKMFENLKAKSPFCQSEWFLKPSKALKLSIVTISNQNFDEN